ncbi:uncharacterized protein LOC127702642 isoform X4 [Mytilus californianus]|uniref:uncharacterized protein LOC127702642 isoform X3 n=1 Tax=Mytilus californianus TaxID=6549 RepID=UPI0022466C9C|nr:uncharacterized protein LOC127702642 isoform X3 [Mytilus californianus]XP_052062911.1 uncharacterized protein LOC127702642 isoform X4 [Mytilus californianus]
MVELVDTFEDAHVNVTQDLSKDLNEIRRQQMQMEDRATKENEISDNFTAEVKDTLKNLNQQLNETHDEIHHLKSFHASLNSKINSADKRISANEEKVPIVNEKLRNLKGELTSIRSDINSVESRQKSLSSDISSAFSRLTANEKRVGFTACVSKDDGSTISAGHPIPFTTVTSSYNVDMSSVKSNGKFTVKISGLYFISASIRSKTDHGFFAIYDDSYFLAYGYTAEHDGKDTYDHSGTVDAVRYFNYGDILAVKPWKTMDIGAWSCLTFVKIK